MTAPQNGDTNSTLKAAEEAHAALQGLLVRSASDQDFRKKLLDTPREALKEFYGKEIAMDVRFIENTADATFVLPDAVDAATELSEHELQAVAGGNPLAVSLLIIASAIELSHAVKTIGDDNAWLS